MRKERAGNGRAQRRRPKRRAAGRQSDDLDPLGTPSGAPYVTETMRRRMAVSWG